MTTLAVESTLLERRENPRWQSELAEALANDQPWAIYSADLEPVVLEYLDHHGDLAAMMRDVVYCPTDPSTVPFMRAELRKHLLAITLLLERVDAIEFKAAEERACGQSA